MFLFNYAVLSTTRREKSVVFRVSSHFVPCIFIDNDISTRFPEERTELITCKSHEKNCRRADDTLWYKKKWQRNTVNQINI